MANVDYTKLMPPPPADLVMKLHRKGGFKNTEKIIFGCGYHFNPETEKNERKAECVCTDCGALWYEEWIPKAERGCHIGYSGNGIIHDKYHRLYDGDVWMCPHCGTEVVLTHCSRVDPYSCYNPMEFIAVFGNINGNFTITEYRVIKQFFKNGMVKFEIKEWRAYIFEKRKCTKLKGWYKNMSGIVFRNEWRQLTRCDAVDKADFYYNSPKTENTTMENSRLKEYMHTEQVKRPVEYLRFYQSQNKVETLFQIGLGELVAKEIGRCSGKYREIPFISASWKEKSPYKILGIDRSFAKLARKHKWGMQGLRLMKMAQQAGIQLTEENIEIVSFQGRYSLEALFEGGYNPPLKILRYLYRQRRQFKFLEDYWAAAINLGYDFDNPVIEFPKNLLVAHDRATAAARNLKDTKRFDKKFRRMKEKLSILDYTQGDICITIAGSGAELVHEGKQLKHCVGGYGADHCKGRSIFFVRHSMWPDTPWYTLQVNLQTGHKLQLHGYHNEADGQKIPQEVHDFVNYWLENIFRPFDVKKMEFINKKSVLQSTAS